MSDFSQEGQSPRAKSTGLDQGLRQYSDGGWGVDIIHQAKRYRRKVGPKKAARQLLGEIRTRIAYGGSPEDVLDPPETPTPEAKPRLSYYLERFARLTPSPESRRHANYWLERSGHLLPEQILPTDIAEWVKVQLSTPVPKRGGTPSGNYKPGTVVRKLMSLQACYSQMVRNGELVQALNPFRDQKALGIPKLNNMREQLLEVGAEEELARGLGPTYWPYALFAVFTGVRQANQFGMLWEHVDWGRSQVLLPVKKGGRRQWVILSPAARQLLEQQLVRQDKAPSRYCWPAERGGRMLPPNFRNRIWLPAVAAAGVPELHWHDLRRTMASRMIQAGESVYTVQRAGGWASLSMVARYAHLADSDLERAMNAVAVFGRKDDSSGEAKNAPS